MMTISVINRTHALPDDEVRDAVRAINRQLAEDFEPHWHFGARLRMDQASERHGIADHKAFLKRAPDRQGDGFIYLLDKATISGAEGYHDRTVGDVPCGFLFLDVCKQAGDSWTMALSHEVLELVGDPLSNLLVQGPDPRDRRHRVFHMFEMCDPVQNESYKIDGIEVSNFVLPGFYTRGEAPGVFNEYLGRPVGEPPLRSFEPAPGGYLCFYDPAHAAENKWISYTRPGDAVAERRAAAKRAFELSRIARRSHAPAAAAKPAK